jgi:hypothetical protein
MAKFPDCNTIGTGAAAIYKLKEVKKAAGWPIVCSSDGLTYNASGDQITHAAGGAGGMANNYAWFVAREPGGRREWCYQRGTGNTVWRIKYSAFVRFIGGTPGILRVPNAADEQVLCGSGSDAAPAGAIVFGTDSSYRVHITAESVPINGCYHFQLWCTNTPAGTVSAATIFQEPVGSGESTDVDPCIVQGDGSTSPSNCRAWFGYGTVSPAWLTVTAHTLTGAGTYATSYVSSEDTPVRPLWTTATGPRIKGLSAVMALRAQAKTYPNTVNKTTDCFVYMPSGASNFLYRFANNVDPLL